MPVCAAKGPSLLGACCTRLCRLPCGRRAACAVLPEGIPVARLRSAQSAWVSAPAVPGRSGARFRDDVAPASAKPTCVLHACAQVSLVHWNQDEEYGGFGGPHAMVPGGYGAILGALAERLDMRLGTPVTAVAYDGAGVAITAASGAGA